MLAHGGVAGVPDSYQNIGLIILEHSLIKLVKHTT